MYSFSHKQISFRLFRYKMFFAVNNLWGNAVRKKMIKVISILQIDYGWTTEAPFYSIHKGIHIGITILNFVGIIGIYDETTNVLTGLIRVWYDKFGGSQWPKWVLDEMVKNEDRTPLQFNQFTGKNLIKKAVKLPFDEKLWELSLEHIANERMKDASRKQGQQK